jgi:hypothetical protein
LAVVIDLGIVIPYAWLIWYLTRPRVRFAFGAWPSIEEFSSTTQAPPGLSAKGKALVAAAILASLALFIGSLMFVIHDFFTSSEVYKMSLREAQDSPCVAKTLGTPLTAEFSISGDMNEGSKDGSADLNIPIHGPKGKGTLQLSAEKSSGIWKITSLVLAHDSERIAIVPSTPTQDCR